MKKSRTILFSGAVGTILAVTSASHGAVLTFDSLSTGVFVGSQYFASDGVTIAATNNNPSHPDVATVFNTHNTNTPDKDLETGWVGGNLQGADLGKILIVAENVTDSDNNGRIDKPDDEHDGGSFLFSFSRPVASLGFDLLDVEFSTPNDYAEFFSNGVSVGTLSFDKFVNPASPFYDPTVVYGDHTANRIQPITTARLGITSYNAVIFHMGECMAMDNINFVLGPSAPNIPEPSMGLIAAGLPMLMAMRRRR